MKTITLTTFLLLSCLFSFSQERTLRYLDDLFRVAPSTEAAYAEYGLRTSDGYLVKTFKNEKLAVKGRKFLEQKTFNAYGQVVSWIDVRGAERIKTRISDHPNGQRASEVKLVDGLPTSWVMYYPDGNVKFKATYLEPKPGLTRAPASG